MRVRAMLANLGSLPQLVGDTLLAVALTGVTLLLGFERHEAWQPLDSTGYVLILLGNLPAAARHRAPVPVLAWCCAIWVLFISAGYWPAVNGLASFLALYTVATCRPPHVAWAGAVVIGGTWVYSELLSQVGSLWSVTAQAIVFPAVVVKFGDNARKLAERNDRLRALTTQLRLEQADRAQRAVTEERMRIARELHDIVAHHLSVVSVQAGLAGYVFASDPATSRSALDTIAGTSRAAQEELRRMLVVLRSTTDEPLESASGLERLDDLVERVRAAGVPVDVVRTGEPRPLPPGLDLCAYRVVQEALTNVLKHAGPAHVTVAVDHGPAELTVRVSDDGRGPTGQTAGHGLIGMRERVRLYDGTLTAGPRPEGGFAVTLTLPVPGTA